MKKVYLSLLCLCYLQSRAQDGIYLTREDFENQKLTFSKTAILKEQYSSVKVKDSSTKVYNYHNAFGYKKDNREWRFVGNKSYEVLNKDGIYVYRLDISNEISTQLYFFSKNADGELLSLSKRNLRKVYANNEYFIELLNSINWRLRLEDEIPPFNVVRVAELYQYCRLNQAGH